MDRLDDAMRELDAASNGFALLSHGTAAARVDLLRAELFARRGELDAAMSLATASFETIAASTDRFVDEADARRVLGEIMVQRGDARAAIDHANAGLAQVEPIDIAPLLAELYHLRGRARRETGDTAGAIDDFRAAVASIERIRSSLQAERFRSALIGHRLGAYEDLVRALLDLGTPDAASDAFAVAEQARNRSLLDLLRGGIDSAIDAAKGDAAVDDDAEQRLLAELERLRAELNLLYNRLADGRADGDADGTRRLPMQTGGTWSRALRQCEQRLEAIEMRLSATRGGLAPQAPPVDARTAMAHCPPDTTVIEYFIAGDELIAFVFNRNEMHTFRGLGRVDDVTDRIARLHFQVARALRPTMRSARAETAIADRMIADVRRELRALYGMLIAPLAEALHGLGPECVLAFIAHGPLHLLPFHALWDGERYLVERFTMHQSPSASALTHLWTAPVHKNSRINGDRPRDPDDPNAAVDALVIGVADDAAPYIAEEANVIAAVLRGAAAPVDASSTAPARALHSNGPTDGGATDTRGMETTLLINAEASCAAVCRHAARAHIVHLACHGRYAAASPLGSGLKLADGWWTLRDLATLRLSADLVTLSGCETGRSIVRAGDDLVGLVRGFLAAGAASLIVSFWRVDDQTTRDFMRIFYETWHSMELEHREGSKARALRAAQLATLRRRPHPAFWAPFTLMGRS